jgi:hypothetical protein
VWQHNLGDMAITSNRACDDGGSPDASLVLRYASSRNIQRLKSQRLRPQQQQDPKIQRLQQQPRTTTLVVCARERRGRKYNVTGENCDRGGDGNVILVASRRGQPAPPRVVSRCATAAIEAEPCLIVVEANSRRLQPLPPPLSPPAARVRSSRWLNATVLMVIFFGWSSS